MKLGEGCFELPGDLKREGLAEIRRVLKPGGRLLVVDLTVHDDSFVGHMITLFGRAERGIASELRAIVADAGFGKVEVLESRFKQLAFLRALP